MKSHFSDQNGMTHSPSMNWHLIHFVVSHFIISITDWDEENEDTKILINSAYVKYEEEKVYWLVDTISTILKGRTVRSFNCPVAPTSLR